MESAFQELTLTNSIWAESQYTEADDYAMRLTAKPSKLNYTDSFNFLKDYLIFLPTGLPTDPSTHHYYRRRSEGRHSPETISFSIFLHAICNCFIPTTNAIRLRTINPKRKPEWISAFWHDHPPVLLNPSPPAEGNIPAFSCEVFDFRQSEFSPQRALKMLMQTHSNDAVIFLITDELLEELPVIQHTPFGVVSFFNKQEWEKYCENLM